MKSKQPGRLAAALVLVSTLLAAFACRSVYYDLWEQVGYEKRHILAGRVEDGREDQQAAQEQFQTTLERFKEVTGFDGGDLEATYSRLNADFERCESRADAVRDRIGSIEQVAADLFREWEAEIDQISSADLRRKSGTRLRDTRARYERYIAAMHRAADKMDPVIVAFRDQVLFLKHNLNAAAIASLEGSVSSVETDVAALVRDMQAAIREADAFLETMEG